MSFSNGFPRVIYHKMNTPIALAAAARASIDYRQQHLGTPAPQTLLLPRFGEIIIDTNDSSTDIITKDFWDSILTEMKLDRNVWFIWYDIGHHDRAEWYSTGGPISISGTSNVKYNDIYLIDNYYNKYKISVNNEQIKVLLKKGGFPQPIANLFTNKKLGCTYDIPLSDIEITYIKKYCTIIDTERFDIFRHKMDDYFSLQNTLSKLGSITDVIKPLEDKIDKLLKHIEVIETTNKSQSKIIEDMENKITELQMKHSDDSGFISYLKKLFAWN